MAEVRVGEGLSVEVRGPEDAPALVLLHAFPLSNAMWAPQLASLEDRWRLVAPDIRGLGASDPGDGQYAIDFFVDDLFQVLDVLGVQRPVACGLSMGGYVLLRALEREGERFQAVVLADTRSAADDDGARLERVEAVRALKRDGAAAYAETFVEAALGRTTLSRRPRVVDTVRRIIQGNSVLGMCGAQLAMACRTDTTAVLGTLELPVLVVVGEEDGLTPREVAGEMAERVPGGRLAVVPGAGHLSSLERPSEFNRVLLRFLDEVAAAQLPPAGAR